MNLLITQCVQKDFVRPLTPAQIAEVRKQVQNANCSNCGGPVDLSRASACAHCGSALSLLDLRNGPDVGIWNGSRRLSCGGNHFDGRSLVGHRTVEQVPEHRLARRQFQSHISTIIECQFDRLGKFGICGGPEHATFQTAGFS